MSVAGKSHQNYSLSWKKCAAKEVSKSIELQSVADVLPPNPAAPAEPAAGPGPGGADGGAELLTPSGLTPAALAATRGNVVQLNPVEACNAEELLEALYVEAMEADIKLREMVGAEGGAEWVSESDGQQEFNVCTRLRTGLSKAKAVSPGVKGKRRAKEKADQKCVWSGSARSRTKYA